MLSEKYIDQKIRRMLIALKVKSFDLSVVFLAGAQMRALNRQSLGHDYVTDVITFDFQEDIPDLRGSSAFRSRIHRPEIEGEIYICPAQARRNARAYGEPLERELLRYIAHGILHLLGHDDSTADLRQIMRREEDRLLTS